MPIRGDTEAPVIDTFIKKERAMQDTRGCGTDLNRFISHAQEAMDSLIVPAYIKDAGLRYAWVNRIYSNMLGLSGDGQAFGKTDRDFFGPDTAADIENSEKDALERGAPLQETLPDLVCPDGVRRSFVRTLNPLIFTGSPVGLLGLLTDVTHLVEESRRLGEKELFFEDLFTNAAAMAAVTDERGRIIRFNKKAVEMLFGKDCGKKQFEGRDILEFIHEDDKQKAVNLWKESISDKKEVNYQIRFVSHDGRVLYLLISGRPIIKDGRVVSFQYQALDIIDHKVQERNLLHTASVETLGQLAGGFAHDFNNLLTVINGYSEIMLNTMDDSHPFYGKMLQIRRAGTQASALTQKILEFSRKSKPEFTEIDICRELADQETLLRHVIEGNIKLVVQKPAEAKKIRIDPTQFAKMLLNLVINAKEAMPAGGEISISTDTVTIDESNARLYDNLRPGMYLVLSVSDTGPGMSDEVKQHIFDPFFTTKQTGKGIGLWVVSSIVKEYRGATQVQSSEGKGTTFRIFFPFSGEECAPPAESRPQTAAVGDGEGKTILVVEDDDTVRELVSEILKHQGHRILTARNGGDALQLVRKYEDKIDLLITDMVMRRIDGIMLSKKIRTILPDIRIILMSGYGEDVIRQEELGGIAFLPKPFLPRELTEKVDAVLSAAVNPVE